MPPTHRKRNLGTLYVAAYIAALAALATWMVLGPVRLLPTRSDPIAPWPMLAVGFYLAEVAVIHLQFRRDAHSFSMSEVPLVLGVFFANPMTVITAQLAGVAVALVLNRRQHPIKLVFNLVQFTIQASVTMLVLDMLVGPFPLPGAATILPTIAATLCALVIAHLLISGAMTATGSRESLHETLESGALSGAATVMNTLLAVGAAVTIVAEPTLWWLGLAPPAFLYLSYRAFIVQRADKARLSSLFEATKRLHRHPTIDRATAEAAQLAVEMVRADKVRIVAFGEEDLHYVTTAGPEGLGEVLRPVILDRHDPTFAKLFGRVEPGLFFGPSEEGLGDFSWQRCALIAPLNGEAGVMGVLMAADRQGDISEFTGRDAQILATLAAQLAVSLENGRLTDSLTEIQKLKDRLEELVQSKDELIASVSHELRTPLTGIVGLASVLAEMTDPGADPEMSEMLGMIVAQSTDLAYIIDDLLAHARSDSGTLTVSLNRLDAVAEVDALIETLGGTVEVRADTPEAVVLADAARLRQVVRNLLTNADRYGGDSVWIEVGIAGRSCRVAVCDDGLGVPSGLEKEIFEPYRSAHDQRSQPGSVGLGLALARKISRLMDGDLRYERADGITRFVMSIPLADRSADHGVVVARG